MFRKTASVSERRKQIEYLKVLIKDAFDAFDFYLKGYIDRTEVSAVMRYLGQFPSEVQLVQTILPEIQEDEPPNVVTYEKFEKYMLDVIANNEFEPEDSEMLLSSFRVLDRQGAGYLEQDVVKQYLMTQGIQFRSPEWENFEAYALEPGTGRLYYEDYVYKLVRGTEAHMEELMKEYDKFSLS
jgi:Ca2+-binding EF-hand superfamily protein